MPTVSHIESFDVEIRHRIEDMIRDLGEDDFQQAHAPLYKKIESDLKKPLYSGCTTFTRLTTVLALVNLKARFGWSDKSFSKLLVLSKMMIPKDNMLSKNHYEAKKILCVVGMEYQKIHACLNDCILYRNQFAKMCKCPTCGVLRYKVKDDKCSDNATTNNSRPTKVCWYLIIIPRFKQLLANEHDAKNLTWHADGRKSDGLLRHLADSPHWKTIDHLYQYFRDKPRNLRLGIASDIMNPFGNLSTNHSSWNVLLMIYNLPPWLGTKRKYIMMCMIIASLRYSGNDIDFYLKPLIEDLRNLWGDGVDVWDGNLQ